MAIGDHLAAAGGDRQEVLVDDLKRLRRDLILFLDRPSLVQDERDEMLRIIKALNRIIAKC